MEKFNWIKEHFSTIQENSWNHISDIVPNVFDEYYLIHGLLSDYEQRKTRQKRKPTA